MKDKNELEKNQNEWLHKAKKCNSSYDMKHIWMPIAWAINSSAKHVRTIMCTQCWHEVNISEAFQNRTRPSQET